MGEVLIEGCCGSAALTMYLFGIKTPLVTYQGSKWRYRKELAKYINFIPDAVELYDVGPWSEVIFALIKDQEKVLKFLINFSKNDPYQIYQNLHGQQIAQEPFKFAAEFLFLQRLAFSGKAVGSKNNIWNSPGFNKTSAYGVKATDKFGEIKPQLNSLIKNLESNDYSKIPLIKVGKQIPDPKKAFLYLDPPYQSSTKYPDGDLSRDELLKLASNWDSCGAKVMVSEAEPINLNWNTSLISGIQNNKASFRSKKEEWLTMNF